MSEPTVSYDIDQHRYQIDVDGTTAGFAVVHQRGHRAFFVHTEIDPNFGGRGLGKILAEGALDAEREKGHQVVPLCPFIAGFIEKNPSYADLVDTAMLESLSQ